MRFLKSKGCAVVGGTLLALLLILFLFPLVTWEIAKARVTAAGASLCGGSPYCADLSTPSDAAEAAGQDYNAGAVLSKLAKIGISRQLFMRGVRFGNNELEVLHSFPSLESVNIAYTNVDKSGLSHIAKVRSLKSLDLSGCQLLKDDDFEILTYAVNLENLVLAGTVVTDEAIPILARIPKLAHLDLSSTIVSDQGIRRLQSIRPTVEVRAH